MRALRTLGSVGPVVAEAMRGNAVLRAFSGYMIFFLAFLLRTQHFPVSGNLALGAMVAAAGAGGLVAMGIGSVIGARAPQTLLFTMLVVATVVTGVCAWFFSFGAALIVAFVAALGTGLAKLALDSIVQREISEDVRSSAFAVSETLHQMSWVVGGLAGLLVSMLNNGQAGLAITAAVLAAALVTLAARRRQRTGLGAPDFTPEPAGSR
jgi:predicted MFS family arabinose efflux permease